jgi:glucose/arabinose dehydrogenase
LYTTHTEPPKTAPADFSYPDSVPVVLQWVLTEWKTDPAKFPFIGEGRELLRINMPTGIHGVQEIAFNNKAKPGDEDYGLLYIGVGDGGSVEIHHGLVSRKPSAAWGSILRIDPRGNNSKNGKYGIPASNPFVGNADCAHEVYAYGFRNPHRLNWSRDGRMFAINIGQHLIEALDIVEPGRFYGWPVREGNFLVHTDHINDVYKLPANDTAYHVTYPVAEFDHDEGTAISGGFEYQGSTVPQLQGKYVFGDIGTGTLFYVDMQDLQIGRQATIKKWNIALKGKRTSLAELCHNERVDMRFGMDASGELYLFTKRDGKVWRIVR